MDLGIPPIVARDHNLVNRLKDLNYTQVAGNRFARGMPTRVRSKDTDIADIWRCLEIAFTAGVDPESFASGVRGERGSDPVSLRESP